MNKEKGIENTAWGSGLLQISKLLIKSTWIKRNACKTLSTNVAMNSKSPDILSFRSLD